MSDFFKGPYEYFIPYIFLLSFLVTLFVSVVIMVSGSCDTKQLLMIVFDKCPWRKVCSESGQIKTSSLETPTRNVKWQFTENGVLGSSKSILSPLVDAKLLVFYRECCLLSRLLCCWGEGVGKGQVKIQESSLC